MNQLLNFISYEINEMNIYLLKRLLIEENKNRFIVYVKG